MPETQNAHPDLTEPIPAPSASVGAVLVEMVPQPRRVGEIPRAGMTIICSWLEYPPAPYAPGETLPLLLPDGSTVERTVRECEPVDVERLSSWGAHLLGYEHEPGGVNWVRAMNDWLHAHPGQTHAWIMTLEER